MRRDLRPERAAAALLFEAQEGDTRELALRSGRDRVGSVGACFWVIVIRVPAGGGAPQEVVEAADARLEHRGLVVDGDGHLGVRIDDHLWHEDSKHRSAGRSL